MTMNYRGMFTSMLMVGLFSVQAVPGKGETSSGRWIMWGEKPARRWEQALVTGNGRHGTMVMGRSGKETITSVHEELFLPAWDRRTDDLPDIAHLLPEVRRLIREDKSREAADLAVSAARKQLDPKGVKEGWPIVTHPAFDLEIATDNAGDASEYRRQLDLETGEAMLKWSDGRNDMAQRVFSSRAHDVNVIELKGMNGKKLDLTLRLKETPGRPKGRHIYRNVEVGAAFKSIAVTAEPGWLSYHADYALDKRGYEGVARVTTQGGKLTKVGDSLRIKDADSVLIVIRIILLEDGAVSRFATAREALKKLPADYQGLFLPHARKHGEMFRRVTFDLGCENQWRDESIEKLLARIQAKGVNPHFLEKVHAMGRYLLISTCGRYPAPLQGIWGANWKPPWAGSFTTDSNVNLAICSASMGNLNECAESYFGYVERQLPGWRANARRILGCRGILMPVNPDPETGTATHYTRKHPHFYWAGGVGWNIRPFYDHGVLTGDDGFLKKRVLPLFRELALFYEDYLVMGEDGLYHIIPSISPENVPPGHGMIVEDSAYDVAVARETFMILLELGEKFELPAPDMAKWKAMLDKLPPYRINQDGALAEWIPEKYGDRYAHRHISHLHLLFPSMEYTGFSPELLQAAQVALDKRFEFDTSSAHGLMHAALMAARLHDVDKVRTNLDRFSRRQYLYSSFVSSHNPNHGIYNLDSILSLPRLLMEMLVFSRPGHIELLPAWPAEYADGTIKGVLVRGGHKMDISWKDGRLSSAVLHAGNDEQCQIKYGKKTMLHALSSGKSYRIDGQLNVLTHAGPTAGKKPNIVLIISDDQAWTDYGFMGHKTIKTPHLDRLAEEGILFTRGYVPTALCRPSLMSLATGHYAHLHGITGNDPSPRYAPHNSALYKKRRAALIAKIDRFDTLPELLGERGYVSHQSGKWWEGNFKRGGFTHGMTRGFPEPGGRHGDDGLQIGRKGLSQIQGFIDMAISEKKPFFLWYAPFLPHTPHNPPKRLMDRYQKEGRPIPIARYYAMCEWFDETCGDLLGYLDRKKIRDNTLVVYVTDNGWIQNPNRGGYAPRSKQTPYEGGVRTPIIFSWPKVLEPTKRNELASSLDLFPTMLEAAGARIPSGLPGLNLFPNLRNKSSILRNTLFGEGFAHDIADIDKPEASLLYRWCIEGPWKLLLTYDGEVNRYKSTHPRTEKRPQLFNLLEDPHEKHNVAGDHPDAVSRLAKKIEDWYPLKERKALTAFE